MKAVSTDRSDLTLTLPGAGGERNLPAQRLMTFDPELGETTEDAKPAILTVWRPDEGERKAIANGAPIELVVSGTGHPPVSMSVGNPPEGDLEALISKAHVDRAVAVWFSLLSEHLRRTDEFPSAPVVVEMWQEALDLAADDGSATPPADAFADEAASNGGGARDCETCVVYGREHCAQHQAPPIEQALEVGLDGAVDSDDEQPEPPVPPQPAPPPETDGDEQP
jgi:hypothetical protein